MVHILYGDGCGKTTSALGLVLRCTGHGLPVLAVQFCKGGMTGERAALASLPGVTLLPVPEQLPFPFQMTREEREAERRRCMDLLARVRTALEQEPPFLLVLDEICAAEEEGFVTLREVTEILDLCRKSGTEAVLTGRNPDPALLELGDYVTCMTCVRHPWERGTAAREGIEY